MNWRPHRIYAFVAGLALVAVACSNGTPGPDGQATIDSGSAVTDRPFTMFSGEEASFTTTFAGQKLFVNFWASWCAPCVQEMPDIETIHQDLGDEITFIGLNLQDRREQAEALRELTGVTYPLAEDPRGDVYADFGGFTMPMTYFVDEDGRVVGQHGGIATEQQFRDLIAQHLTG